VAGLLLHSAIAPVSEATRVALSAGLRRNVRGQDLARHPKPNARFINETLGVASRVLQAKNQSPGACRESHAKAYCCSNASLRGSQLLSSARSSANPVVPVEHVSR